MWQQYRLPGAAWLTDPTTLLELLHRALPLVDPAEPRAFAGSLLRRQPELPLLLPPAIPDRLALMEEVVAQLLSGPLTWLGVLQKDELGGMKDESGELIPDSSFILPPTGWRSWPAGRSRSRPRQRSLLWPLISRRSHWPAA